MDDKNLYKRHNSLRLDGYDYSTEGAYFITICVQDRLNLFGKINQESQLSHNESGKLIGETWQRLPTKFKAVEVDHYVVMPNHLHGILFLKANSTPSESISEIMQWFKTMTTNAYIKGVKLQDWKPFKGKLWQRAYHDHIIRNEGSLNKLREYVLTNPSRWAEDTYYSE